MILGFTGTRQGMSPGQLQTVENILRASRPEEAHHGDCRGADQDFHNLVRVILGGPACKIVIHPGCEMNNPARAGCWGDIIMPVKPFLVRNHDIVDACTVLIATPGEPEEVQRSGTWATIRYARKTGKEVMMVLP